MCAWLELLTACDSMDMLLNSTTGTVVLRVVIGTAASKYVLAVHQQELL
jgi:hypothetical protein